MGRLEQKVVIITGAAGGIGRGIALSFAQEGAQVGVLDLRAADSQRVVDEIIAAGGQAVALGADVADEDAGGAGRGADARGVRPRGRARQ